MTFDDKHGGLVVYLQQEQIELVIKLLQEKQHDLNNVLKDTSGLEDETIQGIQLEARDINDVIHELKFYAERQ